MRSLILLLVLFFSVIVSAQTKLQPGFNGKEYAELLSLSYFTHDAQDYYHLEYRSPEVGLLNQWTFYLRNDNVAAIDIRGTVNKTVSWMENFYAAMIPATGSLQLNDSTTFNYQLSADSKAMVHTGWTIGLACLAPDIEKKVNDYYQQKHVKEFFLFGHSQGGAITFLLRSYLEYEKQKGNIPADIVFKTYCSAAPKPGNTYYAYDYDFITRNGWGFTVVNAADWVPETPSSIQTENDFNPTNPFILVPDIVKKQKWIVRVAVKKIYKKMNKPTQKAQKKFQKYLGRSVYKQVRKTLPQLKEPEYAKGNNYIRAGVPVILMPDEEYRKKFPESNEKYFIHHSFDAYYMLIKKYYF